MNYELKKGFVLRDVCGEHVLMAEGLGVVNFNRLMSLNPSAAFLWQEAERLGEFTEQQLADALCREYDVDGETAMQDVKDILGEWRKEGLLR